MPSLNTDVLTASLGKPIALAYGRHVVAGNLILRHESDDGSVIIFLALGEGEWDGLEELYVNGAEVDISGVGTFHFHRGLPGELSSGGTLQPEGTGALFPFNLNGDQQVDALTPPGLQGLTFSRTAYLALSLPYDFYAPGPELDVRGIYRTRRVRILTAQGVESKFCYSENPVWQIADLLTTVRGLSDSRLDWASFAAAAEFCDETVSTPDGVAPRFVSNIAFSDETDFDTALAAVLNTCRGQLMEEGGVLRIRIAQPRSSIFDFHSDNMIEGSFQSFLRDTRDVANRLTLEFRDTDNNFAVMSKLWNHELQQARTGRIITSSLVLGSMPQHQAERIGNYILSTSVDNNLHCKFSAPHFTLAVMPGDVVRVAHDAAPWSQQSSGASRYKEFEVLEALDNPDGSRDFLCRAYDALTYSDQAGPAQSLIATNAHRRPQAPPPPAVWGLTANLSGELKLRFSIPRNADYRTGELSLVVDEELARTTTVLAASLNSNASTMSVASSSGFLVGDYVNVGDEVLILAGPGVKGAPPTSLEWTVGRAQLGSQAGESLSGITVYRLSERLIHFSLPPGYSLTHPTGTPASGKYYQVLFRPGRLRILAAALRFTGLGGQSDRASVSYAARGISEPWVEGSLPGLRVASGGKMQLQISGPLATGSDLVQPAFLPANVSLGLIYASVEKASPSLPLQFQLLLDGEPVGPVGVIPPVEDEGSSGSGVVFSGATLGAAGGRSVAVNILQIDPAAPGEDFTLNISL